MFIVVPPACFVFERNHIDLNPSVLVAKFNPWMMSTVLTTRAPLLACDCKCDSWAPLKSAGITCGIVSSKAVKNNVLQFYISKVSQEWSGFWQRVDARKQNRGDGGMWSSTSFSRTQDPPLTQRSFCRKAFYNTFASYVWKSSDFKTIQKPKMRHSINMSNNNLQES